MSQLQRRGARLSPTRPHLILKTEHRPFDQVSKESEKDEARILFNQLTQGMKGSFGNFVGFLCGERITYICLPKIFRHRLKQTYLEKPIDSDDETLVDVLNLARLLRETLKRFDVENKDNDAVKLLKAHLPDRSSSSQPKPVSHLMLAELILKDYQRSGLWIDSEQHILPSHRGKVNWKRTIQRGGELWVGASKEQRPIYLNSMTYQRRRNLDHPITQAQLTALHEISLIYAPLLDGAPIILPDTLKISRRESYNALARRLEGSLREVFQERPRRLARLLLQHFRISECRGKHDQVDIYGTTSFDRIFESMCASVLSTQDQTTNLQAGEVKWHIERLPQKLRGSAKTRRGSRQYLDLISQVSSRQATPPYIQCRLDPHSEKVLILDAKYYDFIGKLVSNPSENEQEQLYHVPKIDDVRKQYAYQAWVEKRKRKVIANGLLFPTYQLKQHIEELDQGAVDKIFGEEFPFERLGEVLISGERPLLVLGIPLDELMQRYVKGQVYEEFWLGEDLNESQEDSLGKI